MQTRRFLPFISLMIILTMILGACTTTTATPAPTQPPAVQPAATEPPPAQEVAPTEPPSPAATEVPAATEPPAPEGPKPYKIGFLAGVQDPFYSPCSAALSKPPLIWASSW